MCSQFGFYYSLDGIDGDVSYIYLDVFLANRIYLKTTLELLESLLDNPYILYAYPYVPGGPGVVPDGILDPATREDSTNLEGALTFFDESHNGLDGEYEKLYICLTSDVSYTQEEYSYVNLFTSAPAKEFAFDKDALATTLHESQVVSLGLKEYGGDRQWVEASLNGKVSAEKVFAIIKLQWRWNWAGIYYAIPA